MSLFFFQSLLLSASIKREGESPTASPHSSATDDLHHSDRYQVRSGRDEHAKEVPLGESLEGMPGANSSLLRRERRGLNCF